MSTSEKDIELIDGYIKGRLSSTEKKSFDDRLRNEMEFAALFQELKLAREAIRRRAMKKNFQVLQSLEQTLPAINTVEKSRPPHHKKNRLFSFSKWSVAAGLLLLVFAGSYLFVNGSLSSEEIFQQYFHVYPNMETERGLINTNNNKNPESNNPEKNAFTFYDAQNFTAAIKVFKVLIKVDEKPMYYFFLGNAYLANNQSKEAIEIFQAQKNISSEYQIRINWYLALGYLEQGDTDSAKSILQTITTSEAPSYREKATAILNELK
jgi:tetratricopeptide (TPR) repeat protein